MSRHIRTTVRLSEGLLEQAKQEAERRGETLTSLIDHGLRLVIAESRSARKVSRVQLPVSKRRGGLLPGVDLTDSASLLDVMEGVK